MALEFFHYRRVSALVTSIIIIVVAFVIFMYKLVNVSVQSGYDNISTEFIKNDVEIYSNFYGIPYIYANNDDDLFFAVGYYHASMRLWQMDYYRKLAGGRLSEIFGKETFKVDKFMRCFDIEGIAKRNYDSISGKSRNILEAYCKGVNQFIEDNHSVLPLEFNALSYKPAKWEPYHSLMVGRYLTLELSLSIWADITYGEILEKLGGEKAKLFMPDDEYLTTIYKISENPKDKKNQSSAGFSSELFDIKDKLGIGGSSSGSNCWSFRNTDTNGISNTILANDAHLLLGIPARWIQMKIKSQDINSIGLTLPGIPLILSGRNNDIAWGVTNIMVDGFDYFVERLDPKQENYYTDDSTLHKIQYIVDTIKIAGNEPEIYYKRKTANSYIISDFHVLSDSKLFLNYETDNKSKGLQDRNVLSFRWIGNSFSDDLFALYKINTSRNFDEFKDALRHWSAPALNFHYTDKKGNMGMISAGFKPVRKPLCNPNLPNPAWKEEYGWLTTEKLQDTNFKIYNPAEKFLASANNKLLNSDKNFVSNYWEPESRIKRISELLNESVNFTYRDAQYLQNDYLSVYAKELLSISIPILDNYRNLLTPEEIEILNKMRNWDFILSRASVHASIYTFFYEKLIYNTFYDELGERIYKQYSFISSLPTRKLLALLKMTDSPLFDIQGTKNIENKEFIIFKSFRDGLNQFNEYFEEIPIQNRNYGKMHNLTLEHPLTKSDFLKSAVTLGPFETGGNNTTINNAEWNITNPYKQVIGASMRIINDLSNDFIYTSLPGGMSGDPMHPNYSDQLQIWLNGGYVKLPLDISKTPQDFNIIYKFKAKN